MSELIPSAVEVESRLKERVVDLDYLKRLLNLQDSCFGGRERLAPDVAPFCNDSVAIAAAIEPIKAEVELLRKQLRLSARLAENSAKLGVKTSKP